MNINFNWYEDLPPDCPPEEARIPNIEQFFRLVDSIPPSIEDFYSNMMLYPNRDYNDECKARAVSLLKTVKDCIKKKKFPSLRDKLIVKITLDRTSGVILRTNRKHYSWWMSSDFNPIENYESAENA